MVRRIIEIDQSKCNGCGACAAACHEGAIGMKDGKAVLLRDDYCDGLGDCLPTCPTGAITFVEREAVAYDEAAVLAKKAAALKNSAPVTRTGCPGSMSQSLRQDDTPAVPAVNGGPISRLGQWPIQIKLLPLEAPFYDGAKLLIAADCTAFSRADFHERFMGGPDHHDRLPQAGRGRLRGKADGDHPPERHPGGHRGPYGGTLLRRHPAGGGNGSSEQRQVHPLAGGDTGPGWKYHRITGGIL